MPDANLYLDRVDLSRYLTVEECRHCGASSCRDLVDMLKGRACSTDALESLPRTRRSALATALGLDGTLPAVPSLQHPRPVAVQLVEINDPRPGAPVLVTGNSAVTQEVLLAILATTVSPFFLLFTDTRGDTLDMAMVLGSFSPERVLAAATAQDLDGRAAGGPIVLPVLAGSLAGRAAAALAPRDLSVGPHCAAEMPLFFGDAWLAEP